MLFTFKWMKKDYLRAKDFWSYRDKKAEIMKYWYNVMIVLYKEDR